ncbi:MAG: hypothetical protein M3Q28_07000 [Pseudomonadota bacterium]|nr:hypothetical protein [Pseudomonadota bacterium]
MKRYLFAALILAAAQASIAQVSVSVGQPGFYGRIDIGNAPPPQLVFPQPVIIRPAPIAQPVQPVYLHVPPGHAQKWSKHCHRYDACARPVYFVQDDWYQRVYVPHHQNEHRGSKDKGHGKGKGKDK